MAPIIKRKKGLATYSRRTRPHTQSTRLSLDPSQTSGASVPLHSDQLSSRVLKQRKRITLTSPEPQSRLPSSPESLPRDVLDDQRGDKPCKAPNPRKRRIARQSTKRPLRRLPVNELTIVSSVQARSPRAVSPISDSDAGVDPISDEDSLAQLLFPSRSKRRRSITKRPHPLLSTMRKSLKFPATPPNKPRAKVNCVAPSTLNTKVQKGADRFTGSELFIPPGPKRKRVCEPRVSAALGILDTRKGPHPDVKFERMDDVQDDNGLIEPPEQHTLRILEAAGAFDYISTSNLPSNSVAAPQERPASEYVEAEETSGHGTDMTSSSRSTASVKVTIESPTRASLKESLISAQLASVTAPARRITSYTTASATADEDSDDNYENSLLSDQEEHSVGLDDEDEHQSESDDDEEQQTEAEARDRTKQLSSSSRPRHQTTTLPIKADFKDPSDSPTIPPSKSWISETVLHSSPQRNHHDITISRFFEPFRKKQT